MRTALPLDVPIEVKAGARQGCLQEIYRSAAIRPRAGRGNAGAGLEVGYSTATQVEACSRQRYVCCQWPEAVVW